MAHYSESELDNLKVIEEPTFLFQELDVVGIFTSFHPKKSWYKFQSDDLPTWVGMRANTYVVMEGYSELVGPDKDVIIVIANHKGNLMYTALLGNKNKYSDGA